jgi:hypothetical protein
MGEHERAVSDYTAVLGPVDGTPRYAIGGPAAGKLYFERAVSFTAVGRNAEARSDILRALEAADTRLILRLQIFLRARKYPDIEVTGERSEGLVEAAVSCMLNAGCGREAARKI